jgi:glycosyltransferase 2 family protein
MTGKKLLLVMLLTVLVFFGLAGYGDLQEVSARLANFPLNYLMAALALAVLNYLFRFARWAYYLRVLGINIPFHISFFVFLSGLGMSITPGKVGEFLKSHLLRDRAGIMISKSAPAIAMERVTDVISVVLLGLTGLLLLPPVVSMVLVVVSGLCGGAMLLVTSQRSDWLLDLPVLRRWKEPLSTSREGLRTLTGPGTMLVAIVLGGLAWLSEGVALWIILEGLNADAALLQALPIYAAATLIGAISTLPGGLVGTEGTMLVLLQRIGTGPGPAAAATLLVRLVTLWFAVGIGVVALGCFQRFRTVQRPGPVS